MRQPEIAREICVAVVGAPKSGRSAFIQKGFKGKALTTEENASASVEIGSKRMEVNCGSLVYH